MMEKIERDVPKLNEYNEKIRFVQSETPISSNLFKNINIFIPQKIYRVGNYKREFFKDKELRDQVLSGNADFIRDVTNIYEVNSEDVKKFTAVLSQLEKFDENLNFIKDNISTELAQKVVNSIFFSITNSKPIDVYKIFLSLSNVIGARENLSFINIDDLTKISDEIENRKNKHNECLEYANEICRLLPYLEQYKHEILDILMNSADWDKNIRLFAEKNMLTNFDSDIRKIVLEHKYPGTNVLAFGSGSSVSEAKSELRKNALDNKPIKIGRGFFSQLDPTNEPSIYKETTQFNGETLSLIELSNNKQLFEEGRGIYDNNRLIKEGLNHCVGDGDVYYKKVRKYGYKALTVRANVDQNSTPNETIPGIPRFTLFVSKNGEIDVFRGKNNILPTEEEAAAVLNLIEINGIKIKSIKEPIKYSIIREADKIIVSKSIPLTTTLERKDSSTIIKGYIEVDDSISEGDLKIIANNPRLTLDMTNFSPDRKCLIQNITGSLIDNSEIVEYFSLKTVGGDVFLKNATMVDLPEITKIKGDLNVKKASKVSVQKLEEIDGNFDCRSAEELLIGTIRKIGRDFNASSLSWVNAEQLTEVGENIYLNKSARIDFRNLKAVYGDFIMGSPKEIILSNLSEISGKLLYTTQNLKEISLNNNLRVGGINFDGYKQ